MVKRISKYDRDGTVYISKSSIGKIEPFARGEFYAICML